MIDALLELCDTAPVYKRYHLSNYLQAQADPHNSGVSTKSGCRSFSLANVDTLDGHLVGWLCLCCGFGHRRINCAFEPFADGDCNRPSGLHNMRCKYYAPNACRDAREQHDVTYRDEHSRDGGHNLGMLHDDVVNWFAHIQQPERPVVRHSCGDLRDPTWQSMTGME